MCPFRVQTGELTSIFRTSSRPIRLLCISWYASSASRRSSYSTNAKLYKLVRFAPQERGAGVQTYSLLLAERGAGISQRTSRP